MSGPELAAVITAAAGLVSAIAALIRAYRTQSDLKKHVVAQALIAARAAQQTPQQMRHCQ